MRRVRVASKFPELRNVEASYLLGVAEEIYGERIHDNSSLTAMAYLFRRFGPPPMGSDGYKEIGGWALTTRDPKVYFFIRPGGCSVELYMSYFVTVDLAKAGEKPLMDHLAATRDFCVREDLDYDIECMSDSPAWKGTISRPPRCAPDVKERVDVAVEHILLDFLRPVYVRDVPINIFGRDTESNQMRGRVAAVSPLAGWGIPHRPILDRIAESGAE